MKEEILNAAKDAARDFLYYNRKDDEDLPVNVMFQSIENGLVTFDEIAKAFKKELIGYYKTFYSNDN